MVAGGPHFLDFGSQIVLAPAPPAPGIAQPLRGCRTCEVGIGHSGPPPACRLRSSSPPGPTYERSGYVVVDPLGRRYHPDTVSDYWAAACAKAGVKRIRLHDARHTCGTLMHLEHNVPVAIISAWLGHADTAFTMRTYVHNQPEKLALAAESISSWTRHKKSAQ